MRQDETPYLMDEPKSSNASAPDTASSPAPPDTQQISSDPEPDADDWDVEPGSRKGGSGAAAQRVAPGDGTVEEDELDDLKRISEQSRNLELSLSWEDADEELKEFLASGEEDEDEEDEYDDGDDDVSVKDTESRKSGKAGENDQGMGDETSSVRRCVGSFRSFVRRLGLRTRSFKRLCPANSTQTASKFDSVRIGLEYKRRKPVTPFATVQTKEACQRSAECLQA